MFSELLIRKIHLVKKGVPEKHLGVTGSQASRSCIRRPGRGCGELKR